MYTHSSFLLYEGNPDAFENTIDSLKQAAGFETLHLILVFEKRMYELPKKIWKIINFLPADHFTCLNGLSVADAAESILAAIKKSGAEVLFFLSEGDVIDPTYMQYMDYFFEANGSHCAVLTVPVIPSLDSALPGRFANLPEGGLEPLTSFLDTLKGGSIFLSSLLDLEINTALGMDAFTDLFLKAAIKKNCIGVINTVIYISEKLSPLVLNGALRESLLDFGAARGEASVPEMLASVHAQGHDPSGDVREQPPASICVVVFCEADSPAFEKTLASLEASTAFDDACILFVFHDLYKHSSQPGKEIFSKKELLRPNTKVLFTLGESLTADLKQAVAETGCDIVVPVFEGDTLDPYYLEYIRYFFDENKEACKMVFAPIVKPGQTEEADFFDLPRAGVTAFDLEGAPPVVNRGFAITSGAMTDALCSASDAWAFAEAIYKTIMQTGRYGVLGTVQYFSERPAERFPIFMLESLAEYSRNLFGGLPGFLADEIEARLDEALLAPVQETEPGVLHLRQYAAPERFADEQVTPSVEITEIQNYYDDIAIEGVFYYSADLPVMDAFTIETEAGVYGFTITPVEETNADKIWPKAHFSARFKLIENSVQITFKCNGLSVREILDHSRSDTQAERYGNYEMNRIGDTLHLRKIAPRSFYKASVVIPVYNGEKYLKEAIESVVGQTLDFFAYIQIILVNDGSEDSTAELCQEYQNKYPYNVCTLEQDRQGVSAARNSGLGLVMGKYTAFLDADDKFAPSFLETGIKYLDKDGAEVDMAAFPIQYFSEGEPVKQKPSLNFRFDKTQIVDITEHYEYVQFSACSAILRTDALTDIFFDTRLRYFEDAEFIHKVLLRKMKYALIKEPAYLYRSDNSAAESKRGDPEWYAKDRVFGKAVIEYALAQCGEVTQYTQYLILHALRDNLSDLSIRTNESRGALWPPAQTDIETSLESIAESLQYVDDEIIKSAERVNYWFRCYLLKLKHGGASLTKKDGKPAIEIGGAVLESFRPVLNICSIQEANGLLTIFGYYHMPLYDGVELAVEHNAEKYVAEVRAGSPFDFYFLNQPAHTAYVFTWQIPVKTPGALAFYLVLDDGGRWPVRLSYADNAPLTEQAESFFAGDTLLLTKTPEENKLYAESLDKEALQRAAAAVPAKKLGEAAAVMKSYLEMYSLFKSSRIWLFIDEPESAGSNAEFLFSHCTGKKDGVDKYFVISKNTMDAIRLEDIGTVIEYGSDMHKLLYLFSEKIIVSNLGSGAYNPFSPAVYAIVKQLANYELVYLPRTVLTRDTLPPAKTLFAHSLGLIAVSSETELQWAREGGLEGVAQATGLPKYDSPQEDAEGSCILFMPSYREALYPGEAEYNFEFGESEYCTRIRELLHDERLLDAAEEYEFEIVFAPHEKTMMQIADFDIEDEYITVAASTQTRDELFAAASLLITDSMPVYDYVYRQKPVIYYDFADAEKPETIFGETVADHDALVDLIIAYMANGCQMNEADQNKVEEFFTVIDQDNSRRVYEAILPRRSQGGE
jgi:glycosyltransferase involved in cell wall biosynthesis